MNVTAEKKKHRPISKKEYDKLVAKVKDIHVRYKIIHNAWISQKGSNAKTPWETIALTQCLPGFNKSKWLAVISEYTRRQRRDNDSLSEAAMSILEKD